MSVFVLSPPLYVRADNIYFPICSLVSPFGKELFTRLNACSLRDLSHLLILCVYYIGFEDRILVLVVPVPGHCFSFTMLLLLK